jgi:hypothetical protein
MVVQAELPLVACGGSASSGSCLVSAEMFLSLLGKALGWNDRHETNSELWAG